MLWKLISISWGFETSRMPVNWKKTGGCLHCIDNFAHEHSTAPLLWQVANHLGLQHRLRPMTVQRQTLVSWKKQINKAVSCLRNKKSGWMKSTMWVNQVDKISLLGQPAASMVSRPNFRELLPQPPKTLFGPEHTAGKETTGKKRHDEICSFAPFSPLAVFGKENGTRRWGRWDFPNPKNM